MSMPAVDGDGSSVRPSPAGDGSHKPGGFRIHVTRQGTAVHLSLVAVDEYAAVELYEHFVQALEQGRLNLELK